jgi:small-conductance mechanosensitive channel
MLGPIMSTALAARWTRHDTAAVRRTAVFLLASLALQWALQRGAPLLQAPEAASLLSGLAVLATGIAAIRLAGLLLFRALLPLLGAQPPRIAEDVLLVAAYAAWGVVRLRVAGMDLGSLVTTSAVITAVIAFAMQDTLGNVLGGLFLELDDSIAVGDWVRLDDLSGRVEDIRWRHTAIRTRNGDRVIVPNSALMKSRFTVIGNPDIEHVRWRRWIWFDAGLEVPAPRVIAAAEQALAGAEIPNVLGDPVPNCVLMEIRGDVCRYALRYWLADPRPDDGTDSEVRVHLIAALHRAGIAPAVQSYVVHEIKENDKREASRHAREIEARVAALKAVELFGALDGEEIRALAQHLVSAPFAAGDVITRQGAVAHWLYLLIDGEAEVWVEAPGAPRRKVATLSGGSVFGEMGMMTGEPRRATVTARTDVACYRLDKSGFQGIIEARPELAEEISRVLTARSEGLLQALDEARAAGGAPTHGSILEQVRRFFGLEISPRPGRAAGGG